MNPAPEVERLVDPVHHPQGFHEGLLGDVFGEEGVTQLPADEPVNRRHVAAVELLEGAYIAGPVSPDEINVRRPGGLLAGRSLL